MATKKTRNIGYVEPADYFPKSIRKKAKIGEYAETNNNGVAKKTTKPTKKAATPKKKTTKKGNR